MNLLVKKFWPPVLIILASILAISCEDPGKIGLIINEDNGVLKTAFRDILLPSNVVQFNPRKTSESLTLKAGQYLNDDFGVVYAKCYTSMSPSIFVQPSSNSEFAGFDMTIGYSSFVGSVPLNFEMQTIAVHQLSDEYDIDRTYLRTDELALGTKLADWTFAPRTDDSLQVDSTYIVPLDDAIGRDLFDKLKQGDPIFDDETLFNQYFKGVGFVSSANGRNIFELDRTRLKFTIKYNEFNSDGNPIERSYDLLLGSHSFYNITSDPSGTALSGISADNSDFYPTDDYRYIQYGTMIALRIDLQPFFELSDTIEYMIINKAEIIIEQVEEGKEYDNPPDILQVYFTDESNDWPVIDDVGRWDSTRIGSNYITLQDESLAVPPGFYGVTQDSPFNPDSLNYKINMSYFFQNLYSGNFYSSSEPFLEGNGQIFVFGESDVLYPSRSKSHTETTGLVVHKDNIKLRIHYSYPRIQQTE